MPTGIPRNWTREQLERIKKPDTTIEKLAAELGVSSATVYSLRARIKTDGIDAILEKQERRNERYVRGGAGVGHLQETLEEQLTQVRRLTVALGGRGHVRQYTLTIPSRIGEAFVERWGQNVIFVPQEDGVLIKPVIVEPKNIPLWLRDKKGVSDGD